MLFPNCTHLVNVSSKIKHYALKFFHLFTRVMNHYGYDYLILCEYFDDNFLPVQMTLHKVVKIRPSSQIRTWQGMNTARKKIVIVF